MLEVYFYEVQSQHTKKISLNWVPGASYKSVHNLIGIAEPAWAITGILVQHRYNTDTTLDTNWTIYRNVYHVMGIDGFWGGEFGGYS